MDSVKHLLRFGEPKKFYCKSKDKPTPSNSVIGVGPTTCKACRAAWKLEELRSNMRNVMESIRHDQTLLKFAVSINEKRAVTKRLNEAKAMIRRLKIKKSEILKGLHDHR